MNLIPYPVRPQSFLMNPRKEKMTAELMYDFCFTKHQPLINLNCLKI